MNTCLTAAKECDVIRQSGNCTNSHYFGSVCDIECGENGTRGTSECKVVEDGSVEWRFDVVSCDREFK